MKAQDPEAEGEEVGLLEASRNVPQFLREAQMMKKGKWRLFGVEMSPDTIAIAMVYFVQGILGLARLAVSYFLKDDLHLDPAEVKFQNLFSVRNDALVNSCWSLCYLAYDSLRRDCICVEYPLLCFCRG